MLTDQQMYPLLKRVGLNSIPETVFAPKFEWQHDSSIPMSCYLDAAVTSATATLLSVDDGSGAATAEYFQPYDIVLCEAELHRVISVDIAGGNLYVERGWAGTTPETHLDNDPVYLVGRALPEGSAPGVARQVGVTALYNVTQIFDAVAEITGTQEASKHYAPDDLLARNFDKEMNVMWRGMDRALIYGSRYEPSTNVGRAMGGIQYFVTDEDAQSSAALTEKTITDAMENIVKRVDAQFMPRDMWGHTWPLRKMAGWYSGWVRTDRTNTVGGTVIESLQTPFGTLDYNLEQLIKANELMILNMELIEMGPLQGRAMHELDATIPGVDHMKKRALGEYTAVVRGEDGSNDGAHAYITGFSTTS
jgi:hypothetical protein